MAVQEGNSDVVEVRLAGSPQALEVLLNQKALSFTEQNWMDLKGEWPSTMQGLPMIVMLFLVLPQEVVDSGAQTQKQRFLGPWRSHDAHGHRLGDPCPACDSLRSKGAVAQPEVCSHTFICMGMPVKTIGPAQSPERPVTST